jgi:hypothetical protein
VIRYRSTAVRYDWTSPDSGGTATDVPLLDEE